MESLGERLRLVRGESSQADFASKLGVSQRVIGSVERGATEPNVELLQSLKDQFGIDLNWLLSGEGGPNAVREHGAEYVVSTDVKKLCEELEQHRHLVPLIRKLIRIDSKFLLECEALASAMALPVEAAALVLLLKKGEAK